MKDDLIRRWDAMAALNKQQPLTKSVMRRVVMQVPAVDAVEVVRCRDCEYRELAGTAPFMYYCCVHNDGLAGAVRENDFCSYGVRREDDAHLE